MQNPDGTVAAAAVQWQIQSQRDTAESLTLLREAVIRLSQQAAQGSSTSAPTSRLTKLGKDDDVEAYLEVFERTAQRERWPSDQWNHILAPLLTASAQQASQDLTPEQASQYPDLKQAILAPISGWRRPEKGF